MPLYAVERNLSRVPPEQLQRGLQNVVRVCTQFSLQGKKVRYISSVLLPIERRGLCFFGAEDPEWVKEVQEATQIPYSRILLLLDFTPGHVNRHISSRRRAPHDHEARPTPANWRGDVGGFPMDSDASLRIAQWFEEGPRLFATLIERGERLDQLQMRLDQALNDLRRETIRLQHDNETLRAQRDELLTAFNDLAGHVTQVVDDVLHRCGKPGQSQTSLGKPARPTSTQVTSGSRNSET